jgi:predicted Zn-dependent peptidase
MKKLSILLLIIIIAITGCSTNRTPNKLGLKFPKLNNIEIPEVKVKTLSNGIKVYLLADDKLPIVNMEVSVESGKLSDPADKTGLATIASAIITESSELYPASELKEVLDANAIDIYSYPNLYTVSHSLSYLVEDEELALGIFTDLLANPTFDETEFETLKTRLISEIYSRNDDASNIAFREFSKAINGAEYAPLRETQIYTLKSITIDDIKNFYREFYYPQNMTIAVYGDFNEEEMMQKLEHKFQSFYSNKKKKDIDFEEIDVDNANKVFVVDKKDATQSWVLIGHKSPLLRTDEDYPAMVMLNEILGGSFNSRIFQSVRTAKGYSYSPAGFLVGGYERPGALYLLAPTATEFTVKAADALIEELVKLTEEKVSEEELAYAKDVYLNSFVFQFANRSSFIDKKMTYDRFGIDMNYPNILRKNIENVTVDDVYRVAKKYLHPEALTYVFVCNKDQLPEKLSKFGEVTDLDITIYENAEGVVYDYKKGKEIILGMLDDIKGKKLINSFFTKGTIKSTTPMGDMEMKNTTTVVFPDKVLSKVSTPMGDMNIIINGTEGKQMMSGQEMALPAELISGRLKGVNSSYFGILANTDVIEAGFIERVTIDGVTLDVVNIAYQDHNDKWFINAETKLPQFVESLEQTQAGMEKIRVYFSNYKHFNGVLCPTMFDTQLADGTSINQMTYDVIDFNVEIDKNKFNLK